MWNLQKMWNKDWGIMVSARSQLLKHYKLQQRHYGHSQRYPCPFPHCTCALKPGVCFLYIKVRNMQHSLVQNICHWPHWVLYSYQWTFLWREMKQLFACSLVVILSKIVCRKFKFSKIRKDTQCSLSDLNQVWLPSQEP